QAAAEAAAAAALLRVDERPELSIAYALNYPEESVSQPFPLESALPAAEVYRSGQPLWLESRAALLARYPGVAVPSGYEAVAAVPLIGYRGTRGVLGFSFAGPKTFDAGERQLLESLALQCAQALERAELYEQAQRLNVVLDERVRERTAELKEANVALG